jgi:peptide/nickel transport system permease protein
MYALWLGAVTGTVSLAVFLMMNLLPGNAAQVQLGTMGTPVEEEALTRRLGLREPLLERYLHWLAGLPLGRLGLSLSNGQPVSGIVGQRLPVSLELVVLTILVAIALTIPMALLSALRPGGVIDRVAMVAGMGVHSLAPFVLGLALVLLFAVRLNWLPAIGFIPLPQDVPGNLRSLALPVVTLALPLAGSLTRVLRSDLIEQMEQDYIVTARSTGASRWNALTRHAFHNALTGSITLVGLSLGTLLGGAVVVEQVFALPGLGSGLLRAIETRDTNLVEGIVLLLSVCVALANSVSDRGRDLLEQRTDGGR